MDEITMKNANRLLLRFVSDVDAKLRYGLKQRQNYFEAVQRGEEPKPTYRTEFISSSASLIFGWLSQRGNEFNTQFPQDRLSAHDMLDILATAHHRLQEKMKKG